MRLITRDYRRTEEDDFKLNVQPYLDSSNEAVPLYHAFRDTLTGELTGEHNATCFGWKIVPRGE
jgi:hypothetical protein